MKKKNVYGHLKMSKAQAMKKINDAILKYRLEIDKNQTKSVEVQLTECISKQHYAWF